MQKVEIIYFGFFCSDHTFKMYKLPIIAVISLAVATSCLAQSLGHDERCQIFEGNGVRVDQCDGTKLLSCKDGRCQCPDPANQIYYYRSERIQERSRRSPGKKGSGFKKVAAGAVAGVATYHVAKTVAKGISTTPPPPKYRKVYSCYSRVGGQCALNANNWQVIEGTSTSTSTTAAPGSSTSEVTTIAPVSDNSTTTPAPSNSSSSTSAPEAAAQVAALDLSKIPQCVQYAVCKSGSPTTSPANGTTSASVGFHQKVDFDPRLGVCECGPGFKKNSRDLCEKESGAGRAMAGASLVVILATLVINKMFV